MQARPSCTIPRVRMGPAETEDPFYRGCLASNLEPCCGEGKNL